MNMPPIPSMWSGSFKTKQPSQHFKNDLSCAFNEACININEHHTNFQNSIKLQGQHAAGKLIRLLTLDCLDIAYIKSFDVEWDGMSDSCRSDLQQVRVFWTGKTKIICHDML